MDLKGCFGCSVEEGVEAGRPSEKALGESRKKDEILHQSKVWYLECLE